MEIYYESSMMYRGQEKNEIITGKIRQRTTNRPKKFTQKLTLYNLMDLKT